MTDKQTRTNHKDEDEHPAKGAAKPSRFLVLQKRRRTK